MLAFLAMKGLLGCADWFGTWRWPLTVDAFVSLLRDPDDRWWHDTSLRYPASEAAALALDEVRTRLLTRAPR